MSKPPRSATPEPGVAAPESAQGGASLAGKSRSSFFRPFHSPWPERAALACCALVVVSFLAVQVYDLDIWWHLVIGRDILATGRVPQHDLYTVAGFGRAYHDSHWLFQVAFAALHAAAGWVGVQAGAALLWFTTLFLVFRTCRVVLPALPSALLVMVAALACTERFLPRPELVTYLGTAAFLYGLGERRWTTWKVQASLVGLQVVMTNCHGLFVVGPGLCGCLFLEELGLRLQSKPSRWVAALGLGIATTLATLLTPSGFGTWSYAWLLFQEVGSHAATTMKQLGELSPTFGPAALAGAAAWVYIGLLAAVALTLPRLVRHYRWLSLYALAATAMLAASLTGRRNIVFFALAAAPLLARQVAAWNVWKRPPPRWFPIAAGLLAAACAAWPLSGKYYDFMNLAGRAGIGATPSYFPYGVSRRWRQTGFHGPLWNSNDLGGFVLFSSFPAMLPLSDGRWEIYDPQEIEAILASPASPALWTRLAQHYGVKGVLLSHGSREATGLLPYLSHAPDWHLDYLDAAASFWVKDEAASHAPSASANLAASARGTKPARVADALHLDHYFELTGDLDGRIQNLKSALAFGERQPEILPLLAGLLLSRGELAASEAAWNQYLQLRPDDPAALNELAFFAYNRGDRARALHLLEKAVQLSPNDASARENLKRLQSGAEH